MSTTWLTTLPPRTATSEAETASWLAWRALSAFCLTVEVEFFHRRGRLFQRAGLLLGARGQVLVARGDLARRRGDRVGARGALRRPPWPRLSFMLLERRAAVGRPRRASPQPCGCSGRRRPPSRPVRPRRRIGRTMPTRDATRRAGAEQHRQGGPRPSSRTALTWSRWISLAIVSICTRWASAIACTASLVDDAAPPGTGCPRRAWRRPSRSPAAFSWLMPARCSSRRFVDASATDRALAFFRCSEQLDHLLLDRVDGARTAVRSSS